MVTMRGPFTDADGNHYYDERYPEIGLDPVKNAAGGHDAYANLGSGLNSNWVKEEPGTYWENIGTRDEPNWVLKHHESVGR
jgi:hypothetical protein